MKLQKLSQFLRFKKYQVLTLLETTWKTTKTTLECIWKRLVYKWLGCLHTQPVWKQDIINGAHFQFYYGECGFCGKKITPPYRYGDESGPLMKAVPKDDKGNRDLEDIIRACMRLFVHGR